jgi:hypothetical protein
VCSEGGDIKTLLQTREFHATSLFQNSEGLQVRYSALPVIVTFLVVLRHMSVDLFILRTFYDLRMLTYMLTNTKNSNSTKTLGLLFLYPKQT